PGACVTCHGQGGEGIAGLGPDLTDETWLHVDGSLASLQERIRTGVPAAISRVGVPMPPRGGVRLTNDQLRAVAVYVWTLSRRDGG
ncbi:MAG: c-type cytochrome, partial [Gemmatimonadota bacterium]